MRTLSETLKKQTQTTKRNRTGSSEPSERVPFIPLDADATFMRIEHLLTVIMIWHHSVTTECIKLHHDEHGGLKRPPISIWVHKFSPWERFSVQTYGIVIDQNVPHYVSFPGCLICCGHVQIFVFLEVLPPA